MVRSEHPVAANGPYRLVLTCLDVHEVSNSEKAGRREATPVWTAERTLPQDSDAQKGLRFTFDLPASVGPDPVPSGILSDGKLLRYRMTVNLPGYRKVFQKDSPPVDRYRTLTITAPTPGADFRSELQIPFDGG
ncbi:MAG: hypothetical protein C0524_06630 [Rhodobacter sp.]|nr:hypothetical protein [Rhodobacter sp.]